MWMGLTPSRRCTLCAGVSLNIHHSSYSFNQLLLSTKRLSTHSRQTWPRRRCRCVVQTCTRRRLAATPPLLRQGLPPRRSPGCQGGSGAEPPARQGGPGIHCDVQCTQIINPNLWVRVHFNPSESVG